MYHCPKCKEKSAVRRVYTRKGDGLTKRIEYCINKGCGYKLDLSPDVPTVKRAMAIKANKQGQLEFKF